MYIVILFVNFPPFVLNGKDLLSQFFAIILVNFLFLRIFVLVAFFFFFS